MTNTLMEPSNAMNSSTKSYTKGPKPNASYSLSLCFDAAREAGASIVPDTYGPFDSMLGIECKYIHVHTGCRMNIGTYNISVQTHPYIANWALCEILGPIPDTFNATERELSMDGVLRFATPERFRDYLECLKTVSV